MYDCLFFSSLNLLHFSFLFGIIGIETYGGVFLNDFYWIIDAVLLLFFLVYFLVGFKRGFVRSLFKVGGGIAAFFIALFLCDSLSMWVSGFDFTADLSAFFAETLFSDPMYQISASSASSSDVVSNSFFPSILMKALLSAVDLVGDVTLSVYLGSAVTNILYHFIAFVLLYALVVLVAAILGKVFSSLVASIAVVRFWDRLLGGLFYLLSALLNVYLICMFLSLFGDSFSEWISKTVFLNFFYQNNLLTYFSFSTFRSWLDSVFSLLPSPTA